MSREASSEAQLLSGQPAPEPGGVLTDAALLSVLRAALDAIPDAVHVVDADLRVLCFSRSFADWCVRLGVDVGDPCGRPLREVFPFLPDSAWDEYAEVFRTGEPVTTEQTSEPGGVRTPTETRKIPIVEDGRVVQVVTLVRDLTEHRRRDAEMRFTQFGIEHAGDAAYWVGPDARFVYVNERACRSLGYTREELLSMTVHDIDPDFTEEVWPAHWRDLRERGSFTLETTHRRKDGRLVPVEMVVNYIEFDGEERNCAFARDISERKQAERRLQMTQFAVDHSPDAAYWVSEDASIVYANDQACRMLGYTREEMLALTIRDLDPNRPSAQAWGEHWRRTWGRPATFEGFHQAKDGGLVAVEVAMNPVEFEGKQYHCNFVRDIRERKRQEEERRLVERELQRAQRLEGLASLAGGVAHDFNNILMGVLGYAELARAKAGDGSPITRYIEAIESSVQRASDLARQMLAFAGRTSFSAVPDDLSACIEGVLELVQSAVGPGARVEVDLAPGLAAALLDRAQIGRLVLSLVSNASEALGDAPGVVRIRTAEVEAEDKDLAEAWYADYDLEAGRYVSLSIEDDGCGMDEATRARAFDPFFSTKFTGRGLGLAAALGIVRGHRGAIGVESQVGEGTTVTVLIPVCAPDAEPAG